MMGSMRRPRHWWPLYLGWIVLCAILFAALSGREDPSRPQGTILSNDAGQRALAIAAEQGLTGYSVVHVAKARKGEGEGGGEERWVVLLDRVPHTRLVHAVVVELRAEDGGLVRVRRAEAN
jgi:hypothetical protein